MRRDKLGRKFTYTLSSPGEKESIETTGVCLRGKLITKGRNTQEGVSSTTKPLGIYEITPDANIGKLVFSYFKEYVNEELSGDEVRRQLFSKTVERFEKASRRDLASYVERNKP